MLHSYLMTFPQIWKVERGSESVGKRRKEGRMRKRGRREGSKGAAMLHTYMEGKMSRQRKDDVAAERSGRDGRRR